MVSFPFQLEIIAIRNQNNNSFASLDDFEYHVTDDCMLEPPAADPDSCGDDQFLCREEKICINIVSIYYQINTYERRINGTVLSLCAFE